MSEDPAADQAAAASERALRRERLILFTAVIVALLALLLFVFNLFRFLPSLGWGFDLEAYLGAARHLARGDPYAPYTLQTVCCPFRPGPYQLYLYSPPFAVTMLPFTAITTDSAGVFWYVGRLVLLGIACAVMPVRPTVRLLTFSVAAISNPVLVDMNLGNVSVLVTSLLAFTWRWLDRVPGSIALAIAMCVRPALGLVLIWSLLRRRWWPVLWTILGGLVIVLLSLPFVGSASYFDYLSVLRNVYDATGQDNNLDVGSSILRIGGGPLLASIAIYAGFAIAIGAMLLSLRRDRQTGFMVTIGATLLLSPLLWDHYLAMLLLPAAFLAQRGRWWALGLPLLAWLPGWTAPFLALTATLLPFLVGRRPGEAASTHGQPAGPASRSEVTAEAVPSA
jgi:hypothetical protein